ncbi:unnamed protein product [Cuscuta europaea]|uniref:BHLH domain-containing protein n=1 Tax=Cuscuta europaea TaxID=41803 RepID=A0A9P0YRG4_CUSEU|nr:unnamed protein product [Cuscuta europaea]
MDHCAIPDIEIDEDCCSPLPVVPQPNVSGNTKKSAVAEEEIMELLWQNGQVVVVHAQNQRSVKKPTPFGGSDATTPLPPAGDVRSAAVDEMPVPQHLFMQEDEMAAWLQCPLVEYPIDRYLGADLLYPAASAAPPQRDGRPSASQIRHPPAPQLSADAPRPPIPPGRRTEPESASRFQNLGNLPRLARPNFRAGTSRDSTVVESNETPMVGREYRVSRVADRAAQIAGGNVGCGMEAARTSNGGKGTGTCELSLTTSPGNSGASVSEEKSIAPVAEDRKRKARETDEEGHNAEAESASADAKKQSRASGSTKRSRAAEVHNLSERRRRDRINEKMKALQELIPRCNKSDKASMLDEAIEYLKSLQLQVQVFFVAKKVVMLFLFLLHSSAFHSLSDDVNEPWMWNDANDVPRIPAVHACCNESWDGDGNEPTGRTVPNCSSNFLHAKPFPCNIFRSKIPYAHFSHASSLSCSGSLKNSGS